MNKKHVGGDFDDFLREEGIYDEVRAKAIKRVLALQLQDRMGRMHVSKAELARRMGTSRAAVDRLLDPANDALTLGTVHRAASALRLRLVMRLERLPSRRRRRSAMTA
ncbi:MAG: XRE family transcriptional regulator [Planctomycetes bacterium]|nr:XRE family transcriptional regulator [Planctomycetota bacterium]